MAMIKCKECGKEMSDRANMCPNCGCENDIIFCPECDKQISIKANMCPHCGCQFEVQKNNSNKPQGENYEMAIAALICSFFFNIVGLILGIIVLNANQGKTNSARTMAIAAVIISAIGLVAVFLWLIIFVVAFAAEAGAY